MYIKSCGQFSKKHLKMKSKLIYQINWLGPVCLAACSLPEQVTMSLPHGHRSLLWSCQLPLPRHQWHENWQHNRCSMSLDEGMERRLNKCSFVCKGKLWNIKDSVSSFATLFLLSIVLLAYYRCTWGYTVIFTYVLTINLNWTHPLHLSLSAPAPPS
jgi:hypothetical protein